MRYLKACLTKKRVVARRLFPHEDAIKGTKSNYSNANNEKNCSKEIMETIKKLLEDKLKEMIDKSETQQN